MTLRNADARLVKLEARRQRPNEILLVWRLPDADVQDAVSGAKFAPGDKVICAEWFGDDPLPAPRWYRERLSSEMDRAKYEYIIQSLGRVSEGKPRDPGFAEHPAVSEQRMKELTDNELLHLVFGVAT